LRNWRLSSTECHCKRILIVMRVNLIRRAPQARACGTSFHAVVSFIILHPTFNAPITTHHPHSSASSSIKFFEFLKLERVKISSIHSSHSSFSTPHHQSSSTFSILLIHTSMTSNNDPRQIIGSSSYGTLASSD
jgi:hypothetical protein